eukprot:gene30151-26731_t
METEQHLHLRKQLLKQLLHETTETVPQIGIQISLIARFRSDPLFRLSTTEYAMLLASVCVSVVITARGMCTAAAIFLCRGEGEADESAAVGAEEMRDMPR